MRPDYEYESREQWEEDLEREEVPPIVEYLKQPPIRKERIKVEK